MKKYLFSVAALFLSIALISWGMTGHRTIGRIAENHLTPKAKAGIQQLLGSENLADVSNWADEVRQQPEYHQTGPWHFLNLPLGLTYPEFEKTVTGMSQDNVYSALVKCEHDLTDKATTRAQKIAALKFIVHFVGDLHQPMHISRAEDKGGNTIRVNYEGESTNLHSLWDTKMLEHQGLTYEQLAEKYDHIPEAQIQQWQSDSLIKWIWESYQISSMLYAEVDTLKDHTITNDYYQQHLPIIQERIEKAGVRLAGLLNKLFDEGVPVSSDSPNTATTEGKNMPASDGEVTVCDKVYGGRFLESSETTLINLGGEYPDQKMTIVIKGSNRDKFKTAPEVAFKNKNICVTGKQIMYRGKPEIIVTEPGQIKVN